MRRSQETEAVRAEPDGRAEWGGAVAGFGAPPTSSLAPPPAAGAAPAPPAGQLGAAVQAGRSADPTQGGAGPGEGAPNSSGWLPPAG